MKTTSVREPSIEKNFELRRSARFSSRESSVIKTEEKPFENLNSKDTKINEKALKNEPSEAQKEVVKQELEHTNNLQNHLSMKNQQVVQPKVNQVDEEKLHTLKYSSGGVLPNKSAQTQQKIENNLETKPATHNTLNPSDLPFIDEDERELDEAIRDAIGLAQEEVVASIQLGSTTSPGTYSTASTLLLSERSCSGTDTIHMSEKVIKRDYMDL